MPPDIWRHFFQDVAVDLGTSNTSIFVREKGIVLRQPSVVAVHKDTAKLLHTGEEAKLLVGREPSNIATLRPLKDGVITDFDVTEAMLRLYLQKALRRRSIFRLRVVACVPMGVTGVERRALMEVVFQAGAREVFLLEEPLAAAIGAGLPVEEPIGSMVVDIGGGTSEVAVFSLGGIVNSHSLRFGGDKMDEAIAFHLRRKYHLWIGELTAEEVKVCIGTAHHNVDRGEMEVSGRDVATGLPRRLTIGSLAIREALIDPARAILGAVRATLEKTPPELNADILGNGIVFTGGGALLAGLTRYMSEETGIPCFLAENPLDCVVVGAAKILSDFPMLRQAAKVARQTN